MLIGELARRAEVSRETIRFYQEKGLLKAGWRRAGSRSYRDYSDETLERLILIKQAKSAGFSLREVKYFFDIYGSDIDSIPIEEQKKIVREKLLQIEDRIQQLGSIKRYLMTQLRDLG